MNHDHCHEEEEKTTQPSCCGPQEGSSGEHGDSCHGDGKKIDWLLWISLAIVAVGYIGHWQFASRFQHIEPLKVIAHTSFEMINAMWIGIVLGVLMVALLGKVPREFVMSVLGGKRGMNGILRVTAAGVMLDLCNHGILLVASKLYERGLGAGQVVAFLIASPWNSFSLTLILITLIGLPWTLAFIVFSMLIAIITGLLFEALERKGVLPANPNHLELEEGFRFWPEAKKKFSATTFDASFFRGMLWQGVKESRMVMRWVFFGVVLAGVIRAFMSPEQFEQYFGPTMVGLLMTLVATTIIEVCSEGSTPIAADLMNRANAPGNSFTFLMAGAATDYTEIMVLRDTTKNWRIPLFLPLLTVPQVLFVGWLMNSVG